MDVEILIIIAQANNSRDIISLYSLKNIRISMGETDQNPGLDGGSKIAFLWHLHISLLVIFVRDGQTNNEPDLIYYYI